jgi:hypothetical protein
MSKPSHLGWPLVALAFAIAIAAAALQVTNVLPTWAASLVAALAVGAGAVTAVAANIVADRLGRPRRTAQTGTVLDGLVGERSLELQLDLEKTLSVAHAAVVAATSLTPPRIGTHCWLLHIDAHRDVGLERIARFRPGSAPQNPQRRFRKGQGVVGWCWHTGHWEAEDLRGLEGLGEARYAAMTEEERKGRSLDELRGSVRDFSVILAVPMFERFRLCGVLSLNFDHNVTDPYGQLTSERVRAAMELAAATCARLLRQADVI